MANIQNPDLLGVLFVAFGVMGFLPFMRLGQIFEYPDILRQPTGAILTKYAAGGRALTLTWLSFALGFVPLIFLAPLLQAALVANGVDPTFMAIATTFATVAAVFNIVGLLRWVFLVPLLAQLYLASESDPARRTTIEVIFEAFHIYLGMSIGEFLGYAFAAVWGLMIGLALIQSSILSPLFGIAAIIFSVGLLIGELEFAGWKLGGLFSAVSSSLFLLWSVVMGVMFLIA
ncbi:MAG: DUF4386 domain-containing protein [Anaerolineae bacterium]|nr:DUF4386 domain-containing protein [Anaerolineae bacterium]